VDINTPPGGAINYTTYSPSGASYQDYLIGAQAVAVDLLERLWCWDIGRALTPNGTLVPATYGGAKLVVIDLAVNTINQNIVFSTNVARRIQPVRPQCNRRGRSGYQESLALSGWFCVCQRRKTAFVFRMG
jgi:hypothetical protein